MSKRSPFQCPMCAKTCDTGTKEHLPFRALYKNSTKGQKDDDPVIIKVCQRCNNEKARWDQEILAQYGHVIGIERAEKALKSLKNRRDTVSLFDIITIASRVATQSGKDLGVNCDGIPADTISLWMNYCARGIYYFFKKKVFEGLGMVTLPHMHDSLIPADRFQCPEENYRRINSRCSIALSQKNDSVPLQAYVIVFSTKKEVLYFVSFLFENEEQWSSFKKEAQKGTQKLKDGEPPEPKFKIVPPRQIFDLKEKKDNSSYGVTINFKDKEGGSTYYGGVKKPKDKP